MAAEILCLQYRAGIPADYLDKLRRGKREAYRRDPEVCHRHGGCLCADLDGACGTCSEPFCPYSYDADGRHPCHCTEDHPQLRPLLPAVIV